VPVFLLRAAGGFCRRRGLRLRTHAARALFQKRSTPKTQENANSGGENGIVLEMRIIPENDSWPCENSTSLKAQTRRAGCPYLKSAGHPRVPIGIRPQPVTDGCNDGHLAENLALFRHTVINFSNGIVEIVPVRVSR